MLTAFSTPAASFASSADDDGSGSMAHSNESSSLGITLAVPRRVSMDAAHAAAMHAMPITQQLSGASDAAPQRPTTATPIGGTATSSSQGGPRNSLTPVLAAPAIEVEHPSVIDMDHPSQSAGTTVVRAGSKPGLRILVDTTSSSKTGTSGAMVSPPGQASQQRGATASGSGSARGALLLGSNNDQHTMASFVFPTSAATSAMDIPSLVIEGEHHAQQGISPTAAQLQQMLFLQLQQQFSGGGGGGVTGSSAPIPSAPGVLSPSGAMIGAASGHHQLTSQHLTARGSAGPQRFRRLSSSTTSREAMALALAAGQGPSPVGGRSGSYLSPRHGSQSLRSDVTLLGGTGDALHSSMSYISTALTRRSSLSHSDGILTPLAAPQVPVRSASFLNLMMVPIPTDLCEESLLDLLRLPSASPRGSMHSSGDYSGGSDVSGTSNSLPRKFSSSVTMAPPNHVGVQLGAGPSTTARAAIPSPNDMGEGFQRAAQQASGRLLQVVSGQAGVTSGPSSTLTANLTVSQRRRQNSDSQRSSFSVSSVASSANGSAFFPKGTPAAGRLGAEFKVAPIATQRSSFETAELIEDNSQREDAIAPPGAVVGALMATEDVTTGMSGATIDDDELDDSDDMHQSVELLAGFFLREVASRLALISAFSDGVAPLMVHHYETLWRWRRSVVPAVTLPPPLPRPTPPPTSLTSPHDEDAIAAEAFSSPVGGLVSSISPPVTSPALGASGSSSSPLATTTNSVSSGGSSGQLNRLGRAPSQLVPSPIVEKAPSSPTATTIGPLYHSHPRCPYKVDEAELSSPLNSRGPLAGSSTVEGHAPHSVFTMAAMVSSSSSMGDPAGIGGSPSVAQVLPPSSPLSRTIAEPKGNYCSCVAPLVESMGASLDAAMFWFTQSLEIYDAVLLLPFLQDPLSFPSTHEEHQQQQRPQKKRSTSSSTTAASPPTSPSTTTVVTSTTSPTKKGDASNTPVSLQSLFRFDDASWISVVGTLRVGAVVLSTRCFYYGLHVNLLSGFHIQQQPLPTGAAGYGGLGSSSRRAHSTAGSSRGSLHGAIGSPQGPPVPNGPINGSFSHNTNTTRSSTSHSSHSATPHQQHVPASNTASPTSSSINAGGGGAAAPAVGTGGAVSGRTISPPPPIPSVVGAGGGGAASPWTWLQQQQHPLQSFAVPSLWTTALTVVFWNHVPRTLQLQMSSGRTDLFPDVPLAASVSMSFRTAAGYSANLGSPPTGSPPSHGGGALRSWSIPRGSFHTRRESDGTISGLLWQQQQQQQQQQHPYAHVNGGGLATLAGVPQSSPRSHPAAWVHYHGRLSLSGSSFNQYSQHQQQQAALTAAAAFSSQMLAFVANLEQLETTTRHQLEELCLSMLYGLAEMCFDAAPRSATYKSLPLFMTPPTPPPHGGGTRELGGSSRRGSANLVHVSPMPRRSSLDIPPIISFEEASSKASSSLVAPPSNLAGSMASSTSGPDHHHGTRPVTATPHDDDDDEDVWGEHVMVPADHHEANIGALIDGCGVATAMPPASPGDASVAVEGGVESWATKASPMSSESPSSYTVNGRGVFQSFLPDELRPDAPTHRTSVILPLVPSATSPSAVIVSSAAPMETSGSSFSDPALCASGETHPRHQSSMSSNASDLSSLVSPSLRASAATAGYAATGVAGPLRGAFHAAQHQPPTLQPHRLSVPTHDWVMPSPTSASAGGGDGSNASVGVAVLPRSPLHSPSMELAPTMTSTASSHSLLHYLLPHTNSSFGAPHSAVRGGTSPSSSSAGIGGPATYSPLRSPVIAKVPRSPVDVDTPSMHELGRPMHNASPLHSRMSVTTQDIFDLVDKQLYLMRRGRSVSEVGDESFSMKDGVPHIASGGRSLFGGPLAAGRPASFLSTTSLTSIAGAGSSVASLADPSMFPSSSRASTSHSYVSTMLDRSHPGSQQTSFKRGDGAFAAVAATAGAKTPLHLQYLRLSHQSQPGSGNESHMEIMFSGVSTPFAYQRSPHDSDGRDGGAWPPAAGAASHASHGSQPQHVSIATITSSDNTKSSSQLTPMSATAAVPPAVTPSGGAAGAAATNRHRFPSWPYETVLSASVASNVNSQEKAESRSFTASSSVDDSGSGRAVSSVAAANAISGQRIETMAPAAASDVVDGAAPRTPLRRPSSSSTRDDHHHSSGGSNNVPNSSNAARRHSMVPRCPLAVEGDGQQVMVSASPLAYAPSSPEALQQNTPNIPHRAHDESGAISVASPVITGGLARPQPPSTPQRSFGGRSTMHGTSSSSIAVLKNGEVVIPKPRPPQEHAYQRSRAGLFNGIDEDLIKHPDEFIAAVFRLRRRLISDIIDGERDDREHIAQSESSGRHNLAAAHHVPAKLHNMLYYSFTFGAPWDHDMTPEEEARRTIESVEEVERWSALQLEHTLLTLAQIEEFGRGNVISEYVQRYVTVRGYYETLFEDVLLQREGNFEAVADADQGPATPAALVMPTGVMDVPQPATDETKVVHNTPPATEHSPPPCAAENTNGYVSPLLLSKACAVTPTNRFPEDAMTVNDLEAEQTSLFQRIVDEESAAARNLTLSAQIEFIAAARREQRRHQCRAISESLARVVEMEEPASRREIETLWRDSRNTKAAPYLRQRYVLTMAAASIAREQQQDAPMHPVDLLDDSSSIRHEKHDAAFSSITTVASGPITLQAINPHAPLHFASVMVPHSAPSEDPHENSHGRCLQTTPATNQPPESMLGSFPAGDGAGGAGGMHDHTSGSDAASIEPTSDQNVAGLDGSPLGGSPAAARGSLSAMVVAQQQHHHNDNNLAHQDSIGAEASPSRAASFLGIDAFQSTSEGASRRVSPRSSEGGIDGVPTSPLAREGEEGYLTPAEKNYHPAVVEPQATALFQPAPLPASSLAPVFALTRSIPLLGHSLASLVNTTHRFPFDDAWFLLMLEVQKLKSKMVDAFCTGGGVQQQQGGGRQPQHHQQPRNNGGYRGSDAFGSSTVSSVAPFVAPLHAVAALFAGTTTPDDAELLTRYIANDGCGSPPAPAMPHNALSEDLFFPTKPATTYSTTSLTQKVAGGICMRGVLPLLLDVVMTRKLFVTHTGVEDNQHSLGHGSLHTNDTVLIRLGGAAAVVNGADEAIGAPSGPGILLVAKRDVSYVGGGSRLHQQQQHHSTIFIDRSTPQTPSGTTDAGSTSTQTFHGSTNTQSPALQNTQPGGGAVIGDVQQLSPNGSPWQTQQSTNTNHKEVSLQPLQHTVSNVSLVLFPRRHSTATAPTVQTQQQPAAAAPRVSLLPHQDAYLGEWKGGQRHGFGLYEYPTASSVTLPVSTNHNNNTTANRNNAFYLIFADADNPAPVVKDMYLGNWMNGKRHGAGYYVRVTQQNNNHSPQPPSPHASAGGVGGVRTHPVRWVTCVIYGEWLQDVLQKTTWYGVTESAGPCECV